jgi:hypothetical protein
MGLEKKTEVSSTPPTITVVSIAPTRGKFHINPLNILKLFDPFIDKNTKTFLEKSNIMPLFPYDMDRISFFIIDSLCILE